MHCVSGQEESGMGEEGKLTLGETMSVGMCHFLDFKRSRF